METKQTQAEQSVNKNTSFFSQNIDSYSENVSKLDTYVNIRSSINEAIRDVDTALDVGNGGVFDYDVTLVKQITALDLFLEDLPHDTFPPNAIPRNGSALDIPESDKSFNAVIMVMLLHHLVGDTVKGSLANVDLSIQEGFRVLKPGGKLIIIESCIPTWFYGFERFVFPVASWIIDKTIQHPMTLQYPAKKIASILEKHSTNVEINRIPKGRWVLQYGFKYPSALTPINPFRFIAYKSPES